MPAYILTGAPGSGKTAVLRLLETVGYRVVEEAATDVIALANAIGIAEPWSDPSFIDDVIALQRRREDAARAHDDGDGCGTVFFDRSAVCTLALSRFLGFPPSPALTREVDRVVAQRLYARTVFFIRNLGFVRATDARRISFADSLAFERVHEKVYRDLGFRLVDVPAGPLRDRAGIIQRAVGN